MKTPEEYANELIDKHYEVRNSDGYCRFTFHEAKQCAIIDVENTIEAIQKITIHGHWIKTNGLEILDFYRDTLTILKTK